MKTIEKISLNDLQDLLSLLRVDHNIKTTEGENSIINKTFMQEPPRESVRSYYMNVRRPLIDFQVGEKSYPARTRSRKIKFFAPKTL